MSLAPLPPFWADQAGALHHAFQPIVDLRSGVCFGYEALLRGSDAAGFASIHAVFDRAFEDGVLAQLEAALWAKAIVGFAEIGHSASVHLFCNVDNRGAFAQPAHRAQLVRQLAAAGLPPHALYLEISERHRPGTNAAPDLLAEVSRDGLRIAIDDLGCDIADFDLLRSWPTDLVKIDRSLIAGLDRNASYRAMTRALVAVAHRFGRHVVAEGIETAEELRICQEIGCDFGQGYFIQRPTVVLDDLAMSYEHAAERPPAGAGDIDLALAFAAP